MLGEIESFLRRVRRSLSRSVWLARLLKLPASEGPPSRPGLVMIQIDGLSHGQLEHALEHGEMPFLKRLLRREHYRLHDLYSGLPSTTPAAQAELFYGIPGAVPAFSFRDSDSGRIVRMFEPDAATRFEARQAARDESALLEGGSAYLDTLTGGAAEPHFCPASIGWGPALRAANPFVVLAFLFANFYSFVRVVVLLLLEVALAVHDFVRGLFDGRVVMQELKFIPTRVAIAILLRELCVIGGKIDIARGLPVIHVNFLGYDEQSHRRGPSSLFAHWSLKGIDDAIARLWRAANRSAWRHYDVWVHSDHGQSEVTPYHRLVGYSLDDAVAAAFDRVGARMPAAVSGDAGGIQTQRVRFLGGQRIQRLFSVLGFDARETDDGEPAAAAALGPVGHLYFPPGVMREARAAIARELVSRHRVPVVLLGGAEDTLRAFTSAGDFLLPQDAAKLFGAAHPFLDSLGEDLLRLCAHADAGDLVLLGWRDGVSPVTFADENGGHAGASPDETHAFALLPADTPLETGTRGYLRPLDLRAAALHHLGRPRRGEPRPRRRRTDVRTDTLRVMTYNVHSCVGMDGKLDPERIARVIARLRPDVVALQELDVGRARTLGADQAEQIARHLEMDFHFHPALHLEEERYGDAILTHLPQRFVRAGVLPGLAGRPELEPRGALWVAIDLHGTEIQVINTHLGLLPRERAAQIDALLGAEWLGSADCRAPVVVCGDFNALPSSPVCQRLGAVLRDAQRGVPGHRPRGTFSSRFPKMRIDHIYVSPAVDVAAVEMPESELTRVASDHLPLLVELRIDRVVSPAHTAGPDGEDAPVTERRVLLS